MFVFVATYEEFKVVIWESAQSLFYLEGKLLNLPWARHSVDERFLCDTSETNSKLNDYFKTSILGDPPTTEGSRQAQDLVSNRF